MPYETYNLIHIAGLILVFMGLGGSLLGGAADRPPKLAGMLHGIGLLAMLVGGFGLLVRLDIGFPWPGWVFAKLAIWLVIGTLPMFVRRRAISRGLAWMLALVLGGVAAWLAITKPF